MWLKEPQDVADEAIELRDEGGFDGLKLRLGRDRVAEDLAAIEMVRKTIGNDMQLMVDFNQGLDFAEALERCRIIDDLGLTWIEEPIVYDNLDGYARLTAEIRTPIQIGENFYGPRELHNALFGLAAPLALLAPRQDRTALRITIRWLDFAITKPNQRMKRKNLRIISLRCAPGIIRRTSAYPQGR